MGHFLLNVDPELVRETKRHYAKIARALRDEQRKVKKTPAEIGDEWTGEAAVTVKGNMTALGTMLGEFATYFEDAAGALSTLAKAYDEGLKDVKDLNTEYTKSETSYEDSTKAIMKADHPNRFFLEEAGRTKRTTQGALATDYDDIVERMRTATRTAATTLGDSTYVKVDPGTEKQLASPNGFTTALAAVNDATEESIGDDLSLVSMHDTQDDTQKVRDSKELAEDFQKYWQMDEEEREKFISSMATKMNDPEFAGLFANEVSPQQLASMLSYLDTESDERYRGAESPVVPDMTGEDMDAQKLRLVRVLGTTYGLATQVQGDYELPEGFEDEWFDTMTIDPTQHIGKGPLVDPQSGQHVELASLMSMGQWNPEFMANITTRMIDFERTEVPDGDWSRWGGGDWVTTPTNQTYDPVAQLMEALGNNRAASQMVFSGGEQKELTVNGQDVEVNAYLHYMLTQRHNLPGDDEKLGRALAVSMAEVPGEFTTAPIAEDVQHIVDWGEEETARIKAEQEKNDKPWYVDLGHFLLDLGGLIPGVGEGFDLANASWYGAEGRYDMAALSAASAVPGLGYAAVAAKWGKSGKKAADALELAAKIDRAAAGVPSTVKVTKGVDGTFQPTLKLEIDSADDLAAILKNPPPNTTFVYQGKKFHTDKTGALVVTGTGGMRKFMELSKLPDPGAKLVYQRYPGAPKHEFVVGSNGELILQKNLKDLDNLERGQAFNAQNWKRFEHNEIWVTGPGGKGSVDSYVPGKFIIERKATFYGDLKDPMAKMKKDINELTVQYNKAKIPDTAGNTTNHGSLVGQPLKGQPVLEIPPQKLTPDLIKYAEKNNVTIVDPTGKVYTPNVPLRSAYP